MKTPILGGFYVARSVNAAADRCINLYPEAVPQGGKEAAFLSRCPGLRLLLTLTGGAIRGEHSFGDYLYVVAGGFLYKIDSAYNSEVLGSISGSGLVSMDDNGTQLFVAANPDGYIYNSSTLELAQITDEDFPGASVVQYIDGYFLFIEPDSQRFWITSLLDGESIDPLDFASAEGAPDGLIGLLVDHREAWLFGNRSVEVWYNSGASDFPFERIQGAFIEQGCAAEFSPVQLDNSVFWLGSDERGQGIVWRANGYTPVRVSTHAIETAINDYDTISDAIGYSYQQEGHSFYVLTFPSGNATWVFDVATGLWHERAYMVPRTGQLIRHRSNCHEFFNGEHIVGDYENGNLYALDLSTYDDNGDAQKWLRAWRALPTGANNLNRTFHHSLQLDCQTGVGLDGENDPNDPDYVQGSDPQVILRWSDDGGHRWSNEHWRSMGKIGETGRRVIWRRLGSTERLRDRVYEVSGTDPVKIAVMGAELHADKAFS